MTTTAEVISLAAAAVREARIDLSQGRLFGGFSGVGNQGSLFAGEGRWVTVHSHPVLIRKGQDVGQALREHFGGSGKTITHEHVQEAAQQVRLQGGRPNVHPNDLRPAVAEPPAATSRTAGVVDNARQTHLFVKDADEKPAEVGVAAGQASMFGNTAEAPEPAAAAKDPDAAAAKKFDATATPSMFGAETPGIGGFTPSQMSQRREHALQMMTGGRRRQYAHEEIIAATYANTPTHAEALEKLKEPLAASLKDKHSREAIHADVARLYWETAGGSSRPALPPNPEHLAALDKTIANVKRVIDSRRWYVNNPPPLEKNPSFRGTTLDVNGMVWQKARAAQRDSEMHLASLVRRRDQYVAGTHDHVGNDRSQPIVEPAKSKGHIAFVNTVSGLHELYEGSGRTLRKARAGMPIEPKTGQREGEHFADAGQADTTAKLYVRHALDSGLVQPASLQSNPLGVPAATVPVGSRRALYRSPGRDDEGKAFLSALRERASARSHAGAASLLTDNPVHLSASTSDVLYLSAACNLRDAVTLGQGLPAKVSGLPVHYRWCDAAYVGDWSHPVTGKPVPITTQRIDCWVDKIKLSRGRGVNLPIVGAAHKEDERSTYGEIYDARRSGDRLDLLLGFKGDDALATAAKNYLSIGIDGNFKDSRKNAYGEAIRHVAVTPVPVIHGQQGFLDS